MSVPAMKIQAAPSLATLLSGFAPTADIPVTGIASDSRQLQAGFLFLACQGSSSHGLDYLGDAIAAGACAVAWDSSTTTAAENSDVPMIAVEQLGERLGEIANRFYGSPSAVLEAVGVTGTNGKTTVAWMIAQCLQQLEHRCGYLGTLGFGVDSLRSGVGMTTPAAVELHGHLADFVAQGATHAALEVSSHALDQNRTDGVGFDAVLFTNLTRDHLDFHGDMQSYFEAKAKLFLQHNSNHKIINIDSDFGVELAARCGPDVITISTNFDRVGNGRRYLFVRSVVATEYGSNVLFVSSWGDGKFTVPLPGDFNVANAAIVLAYLFTKDVNFEQACDAIALVEAPPGRMQRIADTRPAIYVDYAHTPDAIESALRALRPHCRGKVWCVLGCGGDRDVGKRPLMGRLAERLADRVVVTTDNPRDEDATSIIANILGGFRDAESATVIEERATAIGWTIESASSSDIVLIAGKGHEDYQEVAGERLPFSDIAIASAALDARAVDHD